MKYDLSVPTQLKETQKWFASIIVRPIDEQNKINPLAPSGGDLKEEAQKFIVPSQTLQPMHRIEIYNQQYWWRLLKALQENLPLVTRLFGYYDFNLKLGVPYLTKYPPDHWSLNLITNRFVKWMEEEYHESDKELILHSARIDCAFVDSFVAPMGESLHNSVPNSLSDLSNQTLIYQPHLFVFLLPYDLFQFRKEFLLQEPEYWVDHDFPTLERFSSPSTYVLFRNEQNQAEWSQMNEHEAQLFRLFEFGFSIDELCEWLEKQDQTSELYQQASEQLGHWIQKWIARSFLRVKKKG